MGRSSTVELRFLVPAVGGSNPSVPAKETKRPEPIAAQGAFLWASGGIRTRKGAELRKREAFSSAARKERSDAAARGRRQADAESLRPISTMGSPHLNFRPSATSGGIRTRPRNATSRPAREVSAITSRVGREVRGKFSGMSQKSTSKRQAPQAQKDQEHLTSRNYQPSSEKRAAINKVPCGPDGPGIKFVASSARKEGHLMWPSSCAGL